jgi:periplasmic copper chaperone A
MVMVKQLEVPVHGSLTFAPRNNHRMCMQPSTAMRPDESVKVKLDFADGGRLAMNFAVRGGKGE